MRLFTDFVRTSCGWAIAWAVLCGLPTPASAQLFDRCVERKAAGDVTCTVTPPSIAAWTYSLPGAPRGVSHATSEADAIALKKTYIREAYGQLCGDISVTLAGWDTQWEASFGYTGYEYKTLRYQRRRGALFTFKRQLAAGCSGTIELADNLYLNRRIACEPLNPDSSLATAFCWKSIEGYQVEDRSCTAGNPVQPGSGNKRHSETDYSGAGSDALVFERGYRSQWPNGLRPAGGWFHTYSRQVAPVPGAPSATTRVLRPDGRIETFYLATPTDSLNPPLPRAWVPTPGNKDQLIDLIGAGGALTGYQYKVFADDSVETYDAAGKLLSISARNGWLTTLTYSDATTPVIVAPQPGLLIAVRNHFGRELRFTYDMQGRLAELLPPGAVAGSGAGAATSPIRYAYEETASLGTVTPVQGQLSSVTWQDGSSRRYHYEDSRWPLALTGITDEAGVRWSTYTYDALGRVTRSEHLGGADRVDFAYSGTTLGSQTTVTDYASGTASSRIYSFASLRGVRYPSATTAPCSLCGNTQKSTAYDAAGNVSKQVAHDGSVTFYQYDAKGRETERATFPVSYQSATTRPALTAASKVVSTEWHASWNLATQIAEPNKTTANTYDGNGMLTGQSWTATTDATGAAKFGAVKSGSTYSTGYGYNASNLATTIVQQVDAVEARRWSFAFNAPGDVTAITATEGGTSSVANLTSSTAHGLLTQLSADNGALAKFTYNARNQLSTAQLPDYGATMSYDARALLTEVRFGASSWLRVVYDQAGNPLRLEDSAGQSQLIVGLVEPSGLGPRSRAMAEAAGARMRALMSSLRDPATAIKWLPLASSWAQVPPPPVVPARILQGMSLAQTQQTALALDVPNLAGERTCCSPGVSGAGAGASQAIKDYLNWVTAPIQMMSYAATQVSGALADEIVMQKSAYKLRKNMCAVGVTKPEFGCHHAHHVVAVAAPRAQPARDVLARVGIDINDAANGLFVPCDKHGRLHTNDYYDAVNLSITGTTKAQVLVQLGIVRAAITSGTL
jgi:YD repeat-containing protein